jgi:hypothetical protein
MATAAARVDLPEDLQRAGEHLQPGDRKEVACASDREGEKLGRLAKIAHRSLTPADGESHQGFSTQALRRED